jgi:hypothetical protein
VITKTLNNTYIYIYICVCVCVYIKKAACNNAPNTQLYNQLITLLYVIFNSFHLLAFEL